jgi:DNA-damage-inducible protein J
MAQTSLLKVRIDTELKQSAEELFSNAGLDTSSVVRLFFKQVVALRRIPLPIIHQTRKGQKVRAWDKPDSLLNNPLRVGEGFKMYSREELHER